MEKVMEVGGIIIGISTFLGMFVAAYICRLKPRDPPPEPVVVIRRDEDPGDPS